MIEGKQTKIKVEDDEEEQKNTDSYSFVSC